MRGKGLALAAFAVSIASGVTAHAAPVVFYIDPIYGSAENTGATAQITLGFFEVGVDDWMSVQITNTTSPSIGGIMTALGFEVPALVSLPITFAPGGIGTYFDELNFHFNVVPSSLNAPGGYDVMITSDNNFEGGSAMGGPGPGQTQTVVLNLGNTGMTAAQLEAAFLGFYVSRPDPYVIARFQSVGPGGQLSDKVIGHIPEPTTLALLLMGVATLRRRRRM